ncbi:hypothetical protein GGR55DRAFT_648871 [Xylaria sp. FL0064]|nr:hypothetical protein GGR55DRAFT_648871 [Xylaria sp. FL0064]
MDSNVPFFSQLCLWLTILYARLADDDPENCGGGWDGDGMSCRTYSLFTGRQKIRTGAPGLSAFCHHDLRNCRMFNFGSCARKRAPFEDGENWVKCKN